MPAPSHDGHRWRLAGCHRWWEVGPYTEGGLLFVVLPLGEVYEGGNFAAVRKVVAALAGKANLGDVEFDVLEGKLLAFELAAAPELAPLSPELGPTSCLARDLATAPFQRAARANDGKVHDDGLGLMTALDRELLSMSAAVRDGVRIVGTVAGVLAFHPAPYRHIPGAHVVVDAATGAGYHGPMAAVVENVSRWAAGQGFPRDAVGELIRNAWVHRDWSREASTTPILVHRNGCRLDVVTPGVLTRVGQVRNPVLQTLCRRAGLVTGHGVGIKDLRADLVEDGAAHWRCAPWPARCARGSRWRGRPRRLRRAGRRSRRAPTPRVRAP